MAKLTKKPVKAPAKKATPKAKAKTPAKKPAAKKATAKTTAPKPKVVTAKTTAVKTRGIATKRPPKTPAIPYQVIDTILSDLTEVKASLDEYAAHLRSLDRKRLNKIGVKREGFAQRAYRLAMDNPEFLPNYLDPERYTDDYDHFTMLQTVVALDRQVHGLLLSINTQCNAEFYTDGLDFYAAVREASKRRVDAAESIYEDLFKGYFEHKKSPNAPETKKEQLRDAKGIISGIREGEFKAVNIKPKLSGGKHEVIDEQLKDTAKFKEDIEGEMQE
jgi:hypothetical protein